ncbi:heavy metal-associated isoprenylated plant protein 42-like isoform X2 [Punica granatum]|uniref:Heavy metal-associated isoprenylated plant protein 42-like isoform X2 n=1 Tax=Punica granatum TaxID=22663 RepID=A0A6P8CFK5_PUNGR|nr:heavy metal-associated isoprenylated plant protein 42-like isoform X2 [Punica granatum]
MAKEADLKIELKVTVNCCDGCKRKVKKLLRSVEGVLKIEIDPVNPKVTVLGNVDPQVLIKKLAKAGKQAEVRSSTSVSGSPGDQKDKKEIKEKENVNGNPKPDKCPDSCSKEKVIKETIPCGAEEMDPTKNQETLNSAKSCASEASRSEGFPLRPPIPEVKYAVYPNMFLETASVRTMEQPYPIGMPYYTVCSYIAPLPPQAAFGQEFPGYGGRQVAAQPMFEAPVVTRVGDYFSDENTVGCHVM